MFAPASKSGDRDTQLSEFVASSVEEPDELGPEKVATLTSWVWTFALFAVSTRIVAEGPVAWAMPDRAGSPPSSPPPSGAGASGGEPGAPGERSPTYVCIRTWFDTDWEE